MTNEKSDFLSSEKSDELINNIYFELTTIDNVGEEKVYQLQMSLTEVTNNTDN